VMRFEHELEQIRNKELDREKAKCHKLGRSSCVQPDGPAAKYIIPDYKAVIPEVSDSLTPAETFPNGMGPNEAISLFSSISCNFVKSHPPATASHSFEKVIKPEPETIHPQQVLWEIPAVSNAQTPCKKREMPEKVPNDPEEDKSHPPASYWINPLGKKVPIPLPIKNQPTPKLADNQLLVDNHFPITKADLCERRVTEPAPRTPEPESLPPHIWENPTCFSNSDNPYRSVKFQPKQGPNIPTFAPPFVPNENKSHPPATRHPYGKRIPQYVPPVLWENPAFSNDDPQIPNYICDSNLDDDEAYDFTNARCEFLVSPSSGRAGLPLLDPKRQPKPYGHRKPPNQLGWIEWIYLLLTV